jgi:hypothetical protein
MRYRTTNRRFRSRATLRAGVLAAALAGTTLAAPLTPTHAEDPAVFTFVGYERPAWLLASDIAVNPPGPQPGEATAPAVERGYVITGDQLSRFDITATAQGQQELAAFVARIAHYNDGLQLDARTYRVYATPSINLARQAEAVKLAAEEAAEDPVHAVPVGTDALNPLFEGPLADVVILPFGTGVGEISAAWDEAELKVTTILSDTPAEPVAPLVTGVLQQKPEYDETWEAAGPTHCYDRKQNNTAWFDPCRSWHILHKDGDPHRTSWGHKQWGTAKSKSIWYLTNFEVKAWPARESAHQAWLDWAPGADEERGNCTTTTVGAEVNGFMLEKSTQHCDEWDITKYEKGGDFVNDWRGRARRSERRVAAVKATATANGYSPTNAVRYDYYAR